MSHPYHKQKTTAVWDYDVRQLNFSKTEVLQWYLSRRIQQADWQGLRKKDIKQHLPNLAISAGLKQLLVYTLSL